MIIEKFDPHKVWSVALYDADQKFYYLKRFQLEASQKIQSFLGENSESKLQLISDVDYPRFEVVFGGSDAYREALVVDAEEFIGVKSFKAKGKRLTTFEVEAINELEPVRFKEKQTETQNGDENEIDENEPDGEAEVTTISSNGNADSDEVPEVVKTKSAAKKAIPSTDDSAILTEDITGSKKSEDEFDGAQLSLF
jgi:topoisomerase-4 subunit A